MTHYTSTFVSMISILDRAKDRIQDLSKCVSTTHKRYKEHPDNL